ncbi:MAG: PorT family protein [Chitinophagaceae bacterium]|nr:PorT family protein [Chitinophagaceae bacterium]
MKKVFLSFFLAASFYGASAQVQFGAKAGVNIANLTGDDVDGLKSKIGFNVGAFAEIPVTEKFSVKPEAVYSDQGAKVDGDGDGKLNLGYINIPVLAKYNIAQGFFAETGPQIGFLLSAKAKSDGESVDIKDGLKSTDFSWAFGLGYELTQGFGVNARYNLGLSSISDDDNVKTKNGLFQVGVFYKFGGSKK